jgi:hypothetical protein
MILARDYVENFYHSKKPFTDYAELLRIRADQH